MSDAAPIYAIGDIHGHLALLEGAHARILADAGGGNPRIVHVGDLIDRGPDCRGVVRHLQQGRAAGRDWIVLKGNHDRFLPRFLADPDWIDPGVGSGQHWTRHPGLGADATLRSWGVDPDLPRAEIWARARERMEGDAAWLDALPLMHRAPGLVFVHAGIRPGVPLHEQAEQDLLWIRRGFLDDPRDHGALIVHGHTAIGRATHHGNRLNIDSSAAYGGPLSAVVIEGGRAFLLTGAGREELLP